MTIRFLSPAEREMFEAVTYYEIQAENLGDNFLNLIEEAVTEITEHPKTWPEIDEGIHRRMVRHFPYSILYRLSPKTLNQLLL